MYFRLNFIIRERIKIYVAYYIKAETKYNIHSPFLYEFIDFVFDSDRIYYDFIHLQEASEFIKRNTKIIPSDSFSIDHHQNGMSIEQLYKKAGHPMSNYECLYRIGLFLKSKNILELGACVGMSGLSLALAGKSGNIISLEGNQFLSSHCRNLFDQVNVKNIHCIHSDFNDYLDTTAVRDFDLVFLDGDHQYDSSLNYISKILNLTNDSAVIIMDDIHWSSGMYKAWKQIINHPYVQCSLETTRWGFLFKNKLLTEGNYVYINENLKPWKIGLF